MFTHTKAHKMAGLLLVALLVSAAKTSAQTTIASFFKAMPDSLMPYLSTNNRLDMIDFMEANMKAEVTNLLDKKSEMTRLTADSLSIRMSDALCIDMALLTADSTMIEVTKTYTTERRQSEVVRLLFTPDWRLVSSATVSSSLLLRDDKLSDDAHF